MIRYEGPKGGPGMREMLNPTSAIAGMGLGSSVALITDGRFSGATAARRSAMYRRRQRSADRLHWWKREILLRSIFRSLRFSLMYRMKCWKREERTGHLENLR